MDRAAGRIGDNAPVSDSEALARWFENTARCLPWRKEPRDPYRTLVSEIMLQQTQVDRVVPRFVEFVERWPDITSLAEASVDDVLGVWSGLGYYRRARMLHALARGLVSRNGGELPGDIAGLRALPGVGEYTAAAVGSLAFDLPEPVLDGNVLRVAARVTAFEGDVRGAEFRRRTTDWVRGLFGERSPGLINEALMELGAMVCSPTGSRCRECPFRNGCEGRRSGRPEDFPVPRRVRSPEAVRWVAACGVDRSGRWLLRRVEEGPILRGLWLPAFGNLEREDDPAGAALRLLPPRLRGTPGTVGSPVRHHITHRRIEVTPVFFGIDHVELSAAVWRWTVPGAGGVGTSSLLSKLLKSFERLEKG